MTVPFVATLPHCFYGGTYKLHFARVSSMYMPQWNYSKCSRFTPKDGYVKQKLRTGVRYNPIRNPSVDSFSRTSGADIKMEPSTAYHGFRFVSKCVLSDALLFYTLNDIVVSKQRYF